MSLYFTIILLVCTLDESWTENINSIETNDLNERDFAMRLLSNDYYLTQFKFIPIYSEKVDIKIYYECLCPDCIKFDVEQFSPVLETMNQYLEIHTYPYGNAKTIKKNGKIEFICQHGPAECYGNKLHVCAIDSLQHITALRFNLCLMNSTEGRGSDDKMADKCGQLMGCDSEAIKACARSNRGTELLLYYGEQSKMANFNYVPYVLINGKVYNTDGNKDFKDAVCAAFDNPPPPCTNIW
ncbi:GILT-like protein 2 [Danaus plexippus]|uniref:GILT-like protein 2 n=1 Tax=Danaus plexippus TaxID=13037 RepID=UPI002AB03E64|nr:GILT-like protein 2 [Danaus plexippus]